MKRIVSILLVATMSFMLCACGSKNLTQEEREKIFYEVAEEKGLLEYVNGQRNSLTVIQGGYSSETSNLPSDEHYIEILDMELIPIDNGRYRPNIKVRNLFPEDAVEYYPDQLWIHVSYLDSDGFAINSSDIRLQHLGYGEGVWTETAIDNLDIFDYSEVSAISITGYTFVSVKGGVAAYREDFTFNPAISFAVDDMLPEGSADSDLVSSVVVEESKLIAQNTGVIVEAKVRNTGEIKRDVIIVYFQLLDNNGDVIGDNSLYVQDLEPGQAAKGTRFTDCEYSDVGTIKFISYAFGTFSGGSKTSWTTKAGDGGDFSDPYVFLKDQLK